jgi:hypothetical protein
MTGIMAHLKRIDIPISPTAPVTPRRMAAHDTPQRCADIESKSVPWMIIIVLLLIVVVIFALWGKLPHRLRFPREAPSGNAPGASILFFDRSLLG